jgi:hypothetical protein
MTHDAVLAALPNSEAEAKSLKDIAQAIGLQISSHTLIGFEQNAVSPEFSGF